MTSRSAQQRVVPLEDHRSGVDRDRTCLDGSQVGRCQVGVVHDGALDGRRQVSGVVEGGVVPHQARHASPVRRIQRQLGAGRAVVVDRVAVDVLDRSRGLQPLDERLVDVVEDGPGQRGVAVGRQAESVLCEIEQVGGERVHLVDVVQQAPSREGGALRHVADRAVPARGRVPPARFA